MGTKHLFNFWQDILPGRCRLLRDGEELRQHKNIINTRDVQYGSTQRMSLSLRNCIKRRHALFYKRTRIRSYL